MFVGEYDSGQFVVLIVRKRFRAKPVQAFLPTLCKQAHTDASPEQAHYVAHGQTIPLTVLL